MMDYSQLDDFTSDPQEHVKMLMRTFEKTVEHHGPDSFTPMCIYLDHSDNLMMTITCRPWSDKDDMYKAFSEMLFAFGALECKCLIFANDVRITKYEPKEPHSKTAEAQDAINVSFISKESSALVSVPYSVKDKNVLEWHLEHALISPLSKENPTELYQGDMVELFYVMSHIDTSPFTMAQLVNYYSLKGFNYQLAKDALVDKIKIEVESDDHTN